MLFLAVSWDAAAQCDPAHVQVRSNAGSVVVTPSGDDDSVNLTCALEVVRDRNLARVRLEAGEYLISDVSISGYEGIWEGAGKGRTRLRVLEGARACQADPPESVSLPAALRFSGGSPTLRYMSIYSGNACGTDRTFAQLLHFTSETRNDGACDDRGVINATVDRVDFYAGADNNAGAGGTAILIAPEGRNSVGCRDKLLGTFSMRFSRITGFIVGLELSMHSGARVDVRQSRFVDNVFGVMIDRAFADASFSFNNFETRLVPPGQEPSEENASYAIVTSGEEPTIDGTTRVSVTDNTLAGEGWCVPFFGTPVVAVMTGNHFKGCGVFGRVETGFLANNLISGSAFFGLGNWIIDGNEPAGGSDAFRIDLLGGSTVGEGQARYVVSDGGGNFYAQ